jgi:peptide deformylase
MPKLNILRYPDPRLTRIAQPVVRFDAALQLVVDDMFETMYAAEGIGLAATQVDIHEQIVVIDLHENDQPNPMVLINPQIVQLGAEREKGSEGCLSLPDVHEMVERATSIKIQAQKVDGSAFTLEATGLLAVCIQHEIDHLQGRVFADHLSPLKRNRIKAKLVKQDKENQESKDKKSAP